MIFPKTNPSRFYANSSILPHARIMRDTLPLTDQSHIVLLKIIVNHHVIVPNGKDVEECNITKLPTGLIKLELSIQIGQAILKPEEYNRGGLFQRLICSLLKLVRNSNNCLNGNRGDHTCFQNQNTHTPLVCKNLSYQMKGMGAHGTQLLSKILSTLPKRHPREITWNFRYATNQQTIGAPGELEDSVPLQHAVADIITRFSFCLFGLFTLKDGLSMWVTCLYSLSDSWELISPADIMWSPIYSRCETPNDKLAENLLAQQIAIMNPNRTLFE
ncbi:hypothetical protein PSTT_08188 [Puccinia striiformis]|uniref:Uncharacterized protein n=1 Tax=Puccinia striiformis TaxID=27350 RepID=A0A2S4VDK8_9BASI|nr:hypothetical protein PSTT_08188 [Puccinia striiformis]